MLTTENDCTTTATERVARAKELKERADRFSRIRDIETVRERHGLQKKKSPKNPK